MCCYLRVLLRVCAPPAPLPFSPHPLLQQTQNDGNINNTNNQSYPTFETYAAATAPVPLRVNPSAAVPPGTPAPVSSQVAR